MFCYQKRYFSSKHEAMQIIFRFFRKPLQVSKKALYPIQSEGSVFWLYV